MSMDLPGSKIIKKSILAGPLLVVANTVSISVPDPVVVGAIFEVMTLAGVAALTRNGVGVKSVPAATPVGLR